MFNFMKIDEDTATVSKGDFMALQAQSCFHPHNPLNEFSDDIVTPEFRFFAQFSAVMALCYETELGAVLQVSLNVQNIRHSSTRDALMLRFSH